MATFFRGTKIGDHQEGNQVGGGGFACTVHKRKNTYKVGPPPVTHGVMIPISGLLNG